MTLRPLATALILTYASATLAQDDPFIQEILKKHYPENAEATEEFRQNLPDNNVQGADNAVCHLREPTAEETAREDERRISEGSRFCMRFHSEKIVDDDSGKRRYLLFTGNNLEEAHPMGGLVAFLIFSGDGGNWILRDKKEYQVGEWGEVPEEWQWLEFSPKRWGVQGKSSYRSLGLNLSNYNLLRDDHDSIRFTTITAGGDNEFVLDCDEMSKEDRTDCLEFKFQLESTFKLRPDLSAENGAYPIEIQVTGKKGSKKQYKNQPYLFQYDGKTRQYIAPADYPLQSD